MSEYTVKKLSRQVYERLKKLRVEFDACGVLREALWNISQPTIPEGIDGNSSIDYMIETTCQLVQSNDKWKRLEDCEQKLRDIVSGIANQYSNCLPPSNEIDFRTECLKHANQIEEAIKKAKP